MERTEAPEPLRKRPDTATPLFLRSPRLSSTLLNLADPVINLLYNLHITIFFDKSYFFTIFLECHQEIFGQIHPPGASRSHSMSTLL